MHVSVRKHLALWRKWTSVIQEEFRSLSCAPIQDENSSCEQAPQWDVKMPWWDLFPHKSSECDCSFLVGPVHDECCDAIYLLRPQCLNHQVVLGKGTFNNSISSHVFHAYVKQHSHLSLLVSARLPLNDPGAWLELYCICSWQQTHISPHPALWNNCVSLKIRISHDHLAQQ